MAHLLQILSHCPYTLEVSKAMAEGGNACWESQSEMATSGGPPSWLADWATLSCLRALARSSDSGQQLPVV